MPALTHSPSLFLRHSGVALITVLLVIFLASITAVSLASLQQLNIRRSTVLQHQQQARYYVLGAEQWARQILGRDFADSEIDALDEDWAQLPPALPVPGGQVSGRIEDLQGRFNLNNLIHEDKPDEAQLAVLVRLLDILKLDGALAQALADWIDSDQGLLFPDGAEDSDYLLRNPAYLAANRPLRSVSELRLIKGADQDVYRTLSPYVSALPADTQPTRVNVNTAPAELLAALDARLDIERARELVKQRETDVFTDPEAFAKAVDGLAQSEDDSHNLENLISVRSDYFVMHAEAVVGDARALLHSVLQRAEAGRSHVLSRSFGLNEVSESLSFTGTAE
jgi:general secretion pathway protein K